MLIYEALKKDHDKLKSLLNRLVNLPEDEVDEREELITKVRDELVPHSRAEESVFYNSIRSIATAKELILHGYEEHMMAEGLLRTLQLKDAMEADWRKTAQKLKAAIEHHINTEETEIFDAAKQLFTHQEAEMMAEAFEQLKPEVREGSFVQNTLDMIANLMPPRFAAPMRTFMHRI
jgi:hemerythrin-like domain-containing protein